MKTKEEKNAMANQMIFALCHGSFGRLSAMLGAKPLELNDNSFSFSFKMFRNANICKIELDEGADLYNLYFIKQKKYTTRHFLASKPYDDSFAPKVVKEFLGLWCDQLKEIFESETGLRVSL